MLLSDISHCGFVGFNTDVLEDNAPETSGIYLLHCIKPVARGLNLNTLRHDTYIQGVSGGIVNILGGGSIDISK